MKPDTQTLEKIYKKKDDIVSREIAGESILVPIRGKLVDMQKIFSLESVAEFVWQNIDGKNNLSDISSRILDTFEVERKQAEADLLEFINELLEAGLITEV